MGTTITWIVDSGTEEPDEYVGKKVKWQEYTSMKPKVCTGVVLRRQYLGSNYLIIKRDDDGAEFSRCSLRVDLV